ncbi:MAG TPA: hypothetical protein VND15_00330 [Candidatus Acidoferrales bacterium]|nr:hypothetical protein [Candidatus Acidoferrales bacterium]
MVKLRQDQADRLKSKFNLTDDQIVKGWKIIQDGHKGVNDFTLGIGLLGRGKGYIRDTFLTMLRENTKAKEPEPKEQAMQKQKFISGC